MIGSLKLGGAFDDALLEDGVQKTNFFFGGNAVGVFIAQQIIYALDFHGALANALFQSNICLGEQMFGAQSNGTFAPENSQRAAHQEERNNSAPEFEALGAS